jgi:hypothetical protein
MFVLLAANSFDRGATAAELIVHRNTARHRIPSSEKLTGLDLQKSPGPEPALAGHPVQSDQAASGPIGRSGPPKKMNGA